MFTGQVLQKTLVGRWPPRVQMCEHATRYYRERDVISQPRIDHILCCLVGVHGNEEHDSLTVAEFGQERLIKCSGQQLRRPPTFLILLLLPPSLGLPLGQRTECTRTCLFLCPRIDTDEAQIGGKPEEDRWRSKLTVRHLFGQLA